jgi:hypothetical protein
VVPGAKLAAQLPGQLIPGGALVTLPVPVTVTANCACGGVLCGFVGEPPQAAKAITDASKTSDKNGRKLTRMHTPQRIVLVEKRSSWVALFFVSCDQGWTQPGLEENWRREWDSISAWEKGIPVI